MTVKTARIEDVLSVRPSETKHGVIWYYDIVLDNEERGSIGKKSEDAFQIGQALTYTSEEGPYGLKFKEFKEGFQNGGGYQRPQQGAPRPQGSPAAAQKTWTPSGGDDRNRSFALAYAKDLAVALIAGKDVNSEQAAKVTIRIACEFLGWLNQK